MSKKDAMTLENLKLFNRLAEECGNRYAAVKFLAKTARHLSSTLPGYLLESKLLTWALTGEGPDIESATDRFYRTDQELSAVQDYLEFVEDKDIKKSVVASYIYSVRARHLVYAYTLELNPHMRSRVRILTRMAWYNYKEESTNGS